MHLGAGVGPAVGVSVLRGQGVGLPTVKVPFWPGVRKSVRFREKVGFYAVQIVRRGKPMSGGFPADCGRKDMGFSAPFGVVLQGLAHHNNDTNC